ncbi:hypothetical protein BD309DRAFT_635111 [Dichomitus squalens]|uniref:Uncharacterized protein n=1 Tax=Dichomitus squalens TaxID=114155 RepID=A0A4Q9NCP1_9APHY|nr:hypothetical protein BD309DRAFT_635111 [Dichomitus squalens]TBU59728.1 hypothetical protein BD310DRAFT_976436 [Dichomitus squalens]
MSRNVPSVALSRPPRQSGRFACSAPLHHLLPLPLPPPPSPSPLPLQPTAHEPPPDKRRPYGSTRASQSQSPVTHLAPPACSHSGQSSPSFNSPPPASHPSLSRPSRTPHTSPHLPPSSPSTVSTPVSRRPSASPPAFESVRPDDRRLKLNLNALRQCPDSSSRPRARSTVSDHRDLPRVF